MSEVNRSKLIRSNGARMIRRLVCRCVVVLFLLSGVGTLLFLSEPNLSGNLLVAPRDRKNRSKHVTDANSR